MREGTATRQRRRRLSRPALAVILALGCSQAIAPGEAGAAVVPRANRRSQSSPPATAPVRPATPSSSRSRSRISSLAPQNFGDEPQLGQGHLRFSLNRVPDCVDPVKLLHAINSPIGNGRLVGASFDYPRYSGPMASWPSGSAPAAATRRRPDRRSSTTACRRASIAWSSTWLRTTAPRPASTPSPTSRSSPVLAMARKPARRQGAERQGRRQAALSPQNPPRSTVGAILHFV